jgi:peptidoglycan/xylan/chitin deacetylase (PgdA/CDA1 family)
VLDDLIPLTIRRVAAPHLEWARGEQVSVPRASLESAGLAQRIQPDGTLDIPAAVTVPPGTTDAIRHYAAFIDRPPASARSPVSYQYLPGWARALVATALGRMQRRSMSRWAKFPRFPLDLSADFAADLERGDPGERRAKRAPVTVSHDIDSAEGLRNLVARFLPLEEAIGARSTNFVVPCGWKLDDGLLAEVRARGHEIGVHGYDHSNRTPFAEPEERTRRINAARPFMERYAAVGYRAPSLLRTRGLLSGLRTLYAYDSSIPTSGGLFPVPNNGCATARPFRIEGIVEVPVSMPRDGSLRFLGYSPHEIAAIWRDCASRIARSGGVVVLLTHCERRFSGTPAMLDAYRRFLEFVRETDTLEFRMARDIAAAQDS